MALQLALRLIVAFVNAQSTRLVALLNSAIRWTRRPTPTVSRRPAPSASSASPLTTPTAH